MFFDYIERSISEMDAKTYLVLQLLIIMIILYLNPKCYRVFYSNQNLIHFSNCSIMDTILKKLMFNYTNWLKGV